MNDLIHAVALLLALVVGLVVSGRLGIAAMMTRHERENDEQG